MNRPILLTGLMGSGKTSVAERLTSEHSYTRVSMATWIKETVKKHYGLELIDKSKFINDKSMRTILQEVGMYMRDIDPLWHIQEVCNQIFYNDNKLFVIDDVRFKNEVEVLSKIYNCMVIKIKCDKTKRLEQIRSRDNVVPTENQMNDSSELEVNKIPYDYVITNNGTIDELFDRVNQILRSDEDERTKT